MTTPNQMWELIERVGQKKANDVSLRRMVVNDVELDGTIVVREVATGRVHEEPYSKLAGVEVVEGDPVLVGEIAGRGSKVKGRTRIVLGKIDNGTSGGAVASQLFVASSIAPDHVKARALYVCDGVNDEEEINQAIIDGGQDAAVVLSQGVFIVSSPVNIELGGTSLNGTGVGQRAGVTQQANGSMIFAAADFVGDAVVNVKGESIVFPVYGVTLRDFSVDFDDTITNIADAVYFSSNRGTIDHVHVFNATADGFRLQGVAGWDTYDSTIINCQASRCADAGIHFDTDSPDCHSVMNVLFDNSYGFHIQSASEQITNCHTYNNSINNIYFDNSGSRTKVVNCKIEGSGEHGVYLDSAGGNGTSDVLFTSCNFKNSGDSADNSYDHIYVDGLTAAGHTRTVIVGNAFSYQSSASPNKPRYAINLTGAVAQGTTIVGNSFGPATHWGTDVIFDNSSDENPAFIRNNKGWLDKNHVIYVRDFFAKNNGFTDAAAAIQEAIDSAPDGGAVIQFDEGVYEITVPLEVIDDGIVLKGAGFGNRMGGTQDGWGTRIKPAAAFTGDSLIIFQRALDDRTLFGGGIEGISLDGNDVAGVAGVVARTESAVFRDVAFHQFALDALTIEGYSSWKAEYNIVDNCILTDGGDSAIVLTTDANKNIITNTTIYGFADSGIQISASEQLISDCWIHTNAINNVAIINTGSRVRINGNFLANSGQHNILLDNTSAGFSDVVISDNIIQNAGTSADNTYDCILFGSTSTAISRVVVTGNTFLHNSSGVANKPRYGVNFTGSGSQNCLLEGNTFGPSSHWGTKPVNDNSSATAPSIIRDNVGFLRDKRQIGKSSSYTAIQLDEIISVTAGSSNKTITLPTAVGAECSQMTIIRIDGGAGNVIVDGNGSETINGATTKTLASQYASITIVPIGSVWYIVAQTGTVT